MSYRHDVENCLETRIGGEGAPAPALAKALHTLGQAVRALDPGSPVLALPAKRDDLELIESAAERLRPCERILVLGTGGSSLGARALTAIAPAPARRRLRFIDNLDPTSCEEVFASLCAARTGLLAISKSGSTLETLATLMVALDRLGAGAGAAPVGERMVAITDPAPNPLRELAAGRGAMVLDHDPALGGRYSVLSAVGLVPAALVGLDPARIRAGAAEVVETVLTSAADPARAAPAMGAALAVTLARERGKTTQVMMPYVDCLAPFAAWHRQLWAESLGKNGAGTTPAPALGPMDQHSQLQLFLDGPADKFFTLISAASEGRGPRLDGQAGHPSLGFLVGRTIGDIVAAQQRATAESLVAAGRPVRLLHLDAVDERVMGALFMHFMIETILAARLLQVEPFDQPAVEEGKRRARAILEGWVP